MIISAKLIQDPSKFRACEVCGETIIGKQLRLYGEAKPGDKPYVIFVHPSCYHGGDGLGRMIYSIELFSCSGGMAEGFRRAGITFDLAFDLDGDACDSYAHNHGHRPVQMDVRDLLRMVRVGWSPDALNLVVADPPCTPWSRAGKRQGTDDERDMLRETVDLIELLQPTVWLIGNVPGLDDSGHWRRVVQPLLGGFAARAGYCVDYASLDAADYGTPQHRRRPFWFGHHVGTPCIQWPQPTHGDHSTLRLDGRAPWVTCRDALQHLRADELGRPVGLRKHGTPSSQPRNGGALLLSGKHPINTLDAPAHTATASGGGGTKRALMVERQPDANHPPAAVDSPHRAVTGARGQALLEWPWDRPSTTIQCDERLPPPGHRHETYATRSLPGAVVISERAASLLQGFPDGWHFAGKTKRSRWSQIGQAMPPQLAEAVAKSIVRWFVRRAEVPA